METRLTCYSYFADYYKELIMSQEEGVIQSKRYINSYLILSRIDQGFVTQNIWDNWIVEQNNTISEEKKNSLAEK